MTIMRGRTVAAHAAALEWQAFVDVERYHPMRDGVRRKVQWAVGLLARKGVVESQHMQAALWFEKLVEAAQRLRGGDAEGVRGPWSDRATYTAAQAANALGAARAAVYAACPRLTQRKAFELAFDGRRSMADMERALGISRQRAATALAAALDALLAHWEGVTAEELLDDAA